VGPPSAGPPLAALATVCVLLSIYAACPAIAAAPDTRFSGTSTRRCATYSSNQNGDGGFGGATAIRRCAPPVVIAADPERHLRAAESLDQRVREHAVEADESGVIPKARPDTLRP
jgi:hypothetical protein